MPASVTLEQLRATATALNKCGINTLEDLRMCIGKDVDSGIAVTVKKTGASTSLLMALLMAEAADKKGGKPNNTKRALLKYWQVVLKPRYRFAIGWLDVAALMILLLIIAGPVIQIWRARQPSAQRVAVSQAQGLPAFHKISGEGDVGLKPATAVNSPFSAIDQIRDRYTLSAIPSGSTLVSSQLLSADLSQKLQGRRMLTVSLKPGNYPSSLKPPLEALLVLSARQADSKTQAAIFEVLVLSLEEKGDTRSATVALPADQLKTAGGLLASHEIFLSLAIP